MDQRDRAAVGSTISQSSIVADSINALASFPRSPCPKNLVFRLSSRYLIVLLTVVALVAADQAVVQPLLLQMRHYAPAINTAGRQRMLSQKLVKEALALEASADEHSRNYRRQELGTSLEEWTRAHRALRFAMLSPTSAAESPEIQAAWSRLQPHFDAMAQAATQMIAHGTVDGGGDSRLAAMLDHEALFLGTMDQIVKLLEVEAQAELRRLRTFALAIATAIVGLVGGLGWFVIRPATRAIRGQVDQLEREVAQRTGQLVRMLESLRQETAQRQAIENRNRALAAQLAHADRVESLGHLAVGLAHEINQPLGAITNYAEACRVALSGSADRPANVRLHEYVERIREAALRAAGIVRRIRNFARGAPPQTAEVDLAALLHEVVELCRCEARRAQVELVIDVPRDTETAVRADAIQIQQVLVNLIQNGIQAMQGCPVERRRLVLRAAQIDDFVHVDVIDGGPGLPDGDAEALFAPFRTTKPDGLGIGLSICRSILKQHRGTLWAKSLSGGGAQFSFRLPVLRHDDAIHTEQVDCLCR